MVIGYRLILEGKVRQDSKQELGGRSWNRGCGRTLLTPMFLFSYFFLFLPISLTFLFFFVFPRPPPPRSRHPPATQTIFHQSEGGPFTRGYTLRENCLSPRQGVGLCALLFSLCLHLYICRSLKMKGIVTPTQGRPSFDRCDFGLKCPSLFYSISPAFH